MKLQSLVLLLLLSMMLLSGCQAQPQAIRFGHDQCTLCKMQIMDRKFGAEIVTKKGKVFTFDSAECMANYIRSGKISDQDLHSLWVVNTARGEVLIDATRAIYLFSEKYPSPMSGDLSAFETEEELNRFLAAYGGERWTWQEVLQKVIRIPG